MFRLYILNPRARKMIACIRPRSNKPPINKPVLTMLPKIIQLDYIAIRPIKKANKVIKANVEVVNFGAPEQAP